jgi:hypothetical protein
MEENQRASPERDEGKRHEQLRDIVVKRLSRALGRPQKVGTMVDQWSIPRPEPLASVNVLVPATFQQPPKVWVFDPNDPDDNIRSETVRTREDIARVVEIVAAKARRQRALRV